MPLEDPAGRPAASAVREQRGGQVVPGALGDDGVDPVVVGGGEERDPAAVGGAGDPDPRIARAVEQHPGLTGEPGDELLDVLDLVVGRVQPDLPGRGAEPARGPGQDGEAGPRQVLGLRADGVLGLPEAMRQQDGRNPAAPRRQEKAGVEHDVLVAARPVHHGDAEVTDGQRRGPGQRDREDDTGRHQCDGGHDRDDDLRSRKPAQTHERTLAMTAACSAPTQPQSPAPGSRCRCIYPWPNHDHGVTGVQARSGQGQPASTVRRVRALKVIRARLAVMATTMGQITAGAARVKAMSMVASSAVMPIHPAAAARPADR